MPDHVYARLLEELLQAEIRVGEYYTDRIQSDRRHVAHQ
jgi:hypothetical protein